MHRYLFLTAVAILVFFTVTRAQQSSRTSDRSTLRIGFGHFGLFINGHSKVSPFILGIYGNNAAAPPQAAASTSVPMPGTALTGYKFKPN
jgi:hypothetical protein